MARRGASAAGTQRMPSCSHDARGRASGRTRAAKIALTTTASAALVVERGDVVEVVEALDLGRSEAGLLEHLAHGRGRNPLARLHAARHALPQAREDPVRRAADEEDLQAIRVRARVVRRRRRHDAEHPALDEVGAEAHRPSASASDGLERLELLEMHEVVDARVQQPLAAAQRPHERMVQRARVRLVARDRPGRPLHDSLTRRDPTKQLLAARAGVAGKARNHALRVVGPAPARREGARHREARTRVRGVTERLGNVPVRFAAGHREGLVREPLDDRRQRRGDAAELERDGLGTPGARPSADLAPDAEQPALVARHATPPRCRGLMAARSSNRLMAPRVATSRRDVPAIRQASNSGVRTDEARRLHAVTVAIDGPFRRDQLQRWREAGREPLRPADACSGRSRRPVDPTPSRGPRR